MYSSITCSSIIALMRGNITVIVCIIKGITCVQTNTHHVKPHKFCGARQW